MNQYKEGEKIYSWIKHLYPICRSITGEGVRTTLKFLKKEINNLKIKSVASGTKVFDWKVPYEWNIKSGFIEDDSGKKIVDFKKNNLHVVGYSTPINRSVSFSKLNKHLFSLPKQPNAIPYVTSYYNETWGFCISHNKRKNLNKKIKYRVVINSSLKKGFLNYAELVIKGKEGREVLLSTYICHPSLANDNLSGPCVALAQSKLLKKKNRRYTYRIIFIPETIGSIVYISRHLSHLKKKVIAGFVITCVGDNNNYSYLPSRNGNTLSDRASRSVLIHNVKDFKTYSFLDRGSDERQFCSPNVDLPICSIMRSKYHEYSEYHTSKDDLKFISSKGLQGGFDILKKTIETLESNYIYKAKFPCEPQLGKYKFYPKISIKDNYAETANLVNFLAYCDGKNDLIEISNKINVNPLDLIELSSKLVKLNLIVKIKKQS